MEQQINFPAKRINFWLQTAKCVFIFSIYYGFVKIQPRILSAIVQSIFDSQILLLDKRIVKRRHVQQFQSPKGLNKVLRIKSHLKGTSILHRIIIFKKKLICLKINKMDKNLISPPKQHLLINQEMFVQSHSENSPNNKHIIHISDKQHFQNLEEIKLSHHKEKGSHLITKNDFFYVPFLQTLNQQQKLVKKNVFMIKSHLSNNTNDQMLKNYVYHVYKGATYALNKLKPPSQKFVRSKIIKLKQSSSQKKCLMLNLDKTLLFAEKSAQQPPNPSVLTYHFVFRPYLFTFLERMSQIYQIYIFADRQRSYSKAAANKINHQKQYIKDILYNEHCFKTKRGNNIKDLRIIKNRSLKDIVIMDYRVQSFGLQLSNGIPLMEFNGCSEDKQLLQIIPFLEELSKSSDVRTVIEQKFNLTSLGTVDWSKVEKHLQFDLY